ncbi:beta-1,3-galactosyl-O-glycosyl-glycoprotein beta-1,6-N-acetylglucosaminyltransferase 4-like [Saccostrea echinata]|uniref:beta-1,3-galactosyl-O-glycosyl-glycoprotein beta-1,6-N-acetylglucosaminyltransferase 4-like n=1 Tax=Saccostrea echinata TaxID=191078 RepID=UPI002A82EEF8|nr:beta-1,3-galactosyl-O-glycosyl-glycoprotein beta-1,6-N-acetylglucosaminyltransferase 4-like [Saccostrea echinata]
MKLRLSKVGRRLLYLTVFAFGFAFLAVQWKSSDQTHVNDELFYSILHFFDSFSPLYIEHKDIKTYDDYDNMQLPFYFQKKRLVPNIDCRRLFDHDRMEIEKAAQLNKNVVGSGLSFQELTKDCTRFREDRGYIMDSLTDEEKRFPIAYTILLFKSPWQFEILLRAIYRPQNFYCVHIDKKASNDIFDEIASIIRCFPNVFLAPERIKVEWGTISVLTPEIQCMEALLKHKWKYFINLTGQEFPLRTNYELVRILTIFNGSNEAEGLMNWNADVERRWSSAGTPPHNIHLIKGAVHVTLNRETVEYMVNNPIAKEFLKYLHKTEIPDEVFFASLTHNPHLGVPGFFKGHMEKDQSDFAVTKPYLSRYKVWRNTRCSCHGQFVRSVCIFGVGDLPVLALRPEFFANKFYIDYQPYTLRCMDELIFNRTKDEYYRRLEFKTDYYQKLQYIKNIV